MAKQTEEEKFKRYIKRKALGDYGGYEEHFINGAYFALQYLLEDTPRKSFDNPDNEYINVNDIKDLYWVTESIEIK